MTISESTFLRQLLDAGLRDALPLAFELERPRDDGDGQDAHALRDVGDDRRRAGARAAAHAGGDEQHVGAVDHLGDAVAVLHRGVAADLRPCARAETRASASMPSCSCVRAVERFSACASVFAQMNSTPDKPARDHVLDRVAAATADADDLDDGAVLRALGR